MADDKRWSCEVRVMAGGTEHSIGGRFRDHDDVLDAASLAIDALGELLVIIDDADDAPRPAPPPPDVIRELWHWRVSWTDAVEGGTAVDHVAQSWTPTAHDAWTEICGAAESLAGLRAALRELRATYDALTDYHD